MSFRLPPLHKKRSGQSLAKPAAPQLVPASASSERRPHGSSSMTFHPRHDLYAPGGPFTQLLPDSQSDVPHEPAAPFYFTPIQTPSPTKNSDKKVTQWRRWMNDVIPALLHPYLALLRETSSLRDLQPNVDSCTCGARKLKVVCVYFESMVFSFKLLKGIKHQ
jgi:hypothetical protein